MPRSSAYILQGTCTTTKKNYDQTLPCMAITGADLSAWIYLGPDIHEDLALASLVATCSHDFAPCQDFLNSSTTWGRQVQKHANFRQPHSNPRTLASPTLHQHSIATALTHQADWSDHQLTRDKVEAPIIDQVHLITQAVVLCWRGRDLYICCRRR